jgi:hypothetical protein
MISNIDVVSDEYMFVIGWPFIENTNPSAIANCVGGVVINANTFSLNVKSLFTVISCCNEPIVFDVYECVVSNSLVLVNAKNPFCGNVYCHSDNIPLKLSTKLSTLFYTYIVLDIPPTGNIILLTGSPINRS